MEKWRCKVCGYIYDPEKGDPVTAIFHPILLFMRLLIAGSARSVGLRKINLKRFRQAGTRRELFSDFQ